MTFNNRPEHEQDDTERRDAGARSGIEQRDLELLSASLDGELAPDARAALEVRLAAEPALARDLARLRATRDLVRLLPELRAPRNFTLSPAQARAARAAVAPAPLALWATFIGMAAGLLLILAGVVLASSGANLPAPQVGALPTATPSQSAPSRVPQPTDTTLPVAPVMDEINPTQAATAATEVAPRALSPLATQAMLEAQEAAELLEQDALSAAVSEAAESMPITMTAAATLVDVFAAAHSGTLELTPVLSDAAANAFAPPSASDTFDGMTASGSAAASADAAQSAQSAVAPQAEMRLPETPKPTETDTPLPSATHTATHTPSATPTETPTLRSTPTLTESPAAAAPVNARGDETISADMELNTRLPLGFLLIGFGAALFVVTVRAVLRRRR